MADMSSSQPDCLNSDYCRPPPRTYLFVQSSFTYSIFNMSESFQDVNTPRAAAAKEQPTHHRFESTPVIRKYGPDWVFTSATENSNSIRKQLASEMEGCWLGAMPVDQFLETYLGITEHSEPLPSIAEDTFSTVPSSGVESARYDSFVSTC